MIIIVYSEIWILFFLFYEYFFFMLMKMVLNIFNIIKKIKSVIYYCFYWILKYEMFLKIIMFFDKNSIEVYIIVLLIYISLRWRKLFLEVFKIFKKEKNLFGIFLNKI